MLLPPRPSSVDEGHAIRAAARRAEDEGDLLGALRLLRLLDEDDELRRWARSLEFGLGLGSADDRALWLLEPAFRHGCITGAREPLRILAADVLRTRGRASIASDAEAATAAVRDPLLVDAGLFELGMLRRYVDEVLAPSGHRQTELLSSWSDCTTSVYEVEEAGAGGLQLRDLLDDSCRDLACPAGLAVGELVYGRVLPLPGGHRFAFAPVEVDRLTARRVLRGIVRAAPLTERLRTVASYQRRSAAVVQT